MRFDVLSLFPELFHSYLQQSLLKLAIEKKLVEVRLWNIRDWSTDRHKSVDDTPYGGGPGMLMTCPPFTTVSKQCRRSATIRDDWSC